VRRGSCPGDRVTASIHASRRGWKRVAARRTAERNSRGLNLLPVAALAMPADCRQPRRWRGPIDLGSAQASAGRGSAWGGPSRADPAPPRSPAPRRRAWVCGESSRSTRARLHGLPIRLSSTVAATDLLSKQLLSHRYLNAYRRYLSVTIEHYALFSRHHPRDDRALAMWGRHGLR
jgi:hypothetical protein